MGADQGLCFGRRELSFVAILQTAPCCGAAVQRFVNADSLNNLRNIVRAEPIVSHVNEVKLPACDAQLFERFAARVTGFERENFHVHQPLVTPGEAVDKVADQGIDGQAAGIIMHFMFNIGKRAKFGLRGGGKIPAGGKISQLVLV